MKDEQVAVRRIKLAGHRQEVDPCFLAFHHTESRSFRTKGKAQFIVSPGCKRLLIDCFVDCLQLDPQSCVVKVRSDLAAPRWEARCCWDTCSSRARRRGCSLRPADGAAGCWTRPGRRRAAAWRPGGLPPPRSGSPRWHLLQDRRGEKACYVEINILNHFSFQFLPLVTKNWNGEVFFPQVEGWTTKRCRWAPQLKVTLP